MYSSQPDLPLRFGFADDDGRDPASDKLPLAERVAAKILAWQAKAVPTRPFVRFKKDMVTYAQADARANRVAHGARGLGIGKGDRVAILARNRLEYLDIWFGLSRIGAIQVPLNTEYKATQIAQVLKRAPVAAVIVEAGLLPELITSLGQLERQPQILVMRDGLEPTVRPVERANLSWIDYEAALAGADDVPPLDASSISGSDVGAVMNTSGTTGPSKGVLVSHAQQYILGRMIAADMGLRESDVYFNCFPLFHNTAQAMITIPVILVGAQMVLSERFSASQFWPEVREQGCTAFYYLGEIVRILLSSTTAADALGARLRVGWGIGASAHDFAEFRNRFGVAMRTGYGSTEANVPCYLPHDSQKLESCGRPVRGFEIRIANEAGEPVATGETGEILVRSSEPYALMLGYEGDAAATLSAWRDLWFHTGDAGALDADGDLIFKGRVKDAIRVRGENISAFEVEQEIGNVDGVAEIAAIAVPGELGGDDLKIVVVRKPDVPLSESDLVYHAQSCLPRFSIPRYVEFVDALPKTPTNKVQKHVLRASPFTPRTWDRAKAGYLA